MQMPTYVLPLGSKWQEVSLLGLCAHLHILAILLRTPKNVSLKGSFTVRQAGLQVVLLL